MNLREMDVETHKKVFGLDSRLWHSGSPKYSHLEGWFTDPQTTPNPEPVPHYTTDIRAAWLVVEKVGLFDGNDGLVMARNTDDKQWHLSRLIYIVEDEQDHYWKPIASADTAPLAICLAALKVMEGV